ncbi:hypothetical protein T08_9917 [Trichinella sp. T8]|nr:hypothetical protein T08_9917 [Trichinella sp. T8]
MTFQIGNKKENFAVVLFYYNLNADSKLATVCQLIGFDEIGKNASRACCRLWWKKFACVVNPVDESSDTAVG